MSRALPGLAVGYLIGSIPFAVLLSRAFGDFDAARQGTGNPGATNVFKHVGRLAGAAVGLLDYFKALLPALLAERWLGWDSGAATCLAVGAVLGHDFSFALRLRGGKGGASTLGAFSYLDFPALMAGPAALTLFPVAVALHASPWGAAHLPAAGRPQGMLPIVTGAGLALLLWARVLPGLRSRAALPAGGPR